MDTQLCSELGKMEEVSERNSAPPQLHHCQYELAPQQPLLSHDHYLKYNDWYQLWASGYVMHRL